MKRFEIEIGVFILGNNSQEVLDKITPILLQLEALDEEGEAACEIYDRGEGH